MNVLDKIKNVTNGLNSCGSCSHLCSTCPYKERGECERELHRDALEVINALRAELKKRTSKAVETKPGFITLTAGVIAYSENSAIWYDPCRIAVRVNDILTISDYDKCKGSIVQLKDGQQTTILVQETLEEILGKIADMRGE